MTRRFKSIATVLATAFTVVAVGVLPTSPVHADHSDGPDVCGAGAYETVAGYSIHGPDGQHFGMLWITRREGSDTICAATTRTYHDRARFVSVKLKHRSQDRWARVDKGSTRYFQGPVRMERNGHIMQAYGQIVKGDAKGWTALRWAPGVWCMRSNEIPQWTGDPECGGNG